MYVICYRVCIRYFFFCLCPCCRHHYGTASSASHRDIDDDDFDVAVDDRNINILCNRVYTQLQQLLLYSMNNDTTVYMTLYRYFGSETRKETLFR
mmetsp:Transcript_17896/g.18088  ORF Transcript_17896/g.18088 Transcript_17896/m.18088 type:complete len:95 (-) Transcript_17896:64-348(-)